MNRLIPLLVAVGSVAVIGTSAFAADLDQVPASASAATAEIQAEQAAVNDDWAGVAIFAAKSYREAPSVANEFNLATAYTRSGQTTLAIPLYADVAERGKLSTARVLYDYRHNGYRPPHMTFNFADEANRRLATLTGESAG